MNKRYRPIILLLILTGLVVFFTTEIRYTFKLLHSRFTSAAAAGLPETTYDLLQEMP